MSRFFNCEFRTKPIGIFLVAVEQHTKFIFACNNFFWRHDVLVDRVCATTTKHFLQRQHRIIGRMIGVMAGGAVSHLFATLHRVIIGNRYCFIMCDQITILRANARHPAAHACVSTRAFQKDCSLATPSMFARIGRKFLFVRAPAQFSWLFAL